jgi:hypothetical protein
MMKRVRMSPEGRREVILRAAVALTREAGCVNSWSRQDVAHACTPPTSLETVKHYYLMPDLRDAVRVLLDK